MFGIPGGTFEEAPDNWLCDRSFILTLANFHTITPFPGTYLYDNLAKYGTMSDSFSDFTYQGAAFIPHTMTREDLLCQNLGRQHSGGFIPSHSFIPQKKLLN